MDSNSTSRGRSRGGSCGRIKPLQTRRVWSVQEEQVLISTLKDLSGKGWKGDNGFRAGYLKKLEDSLKEAFPGTDLRAEPHIHSKLTIWKRTFATLTGILSRSGVGFNDRTHMMDIDDETWNLALKADKNTAGMRFKSFPMFPIWVEIFGKDRANGRGAEDVLDAFTNFLKEDLVAGLQGTEDVDDDVDNHDEKVEATSSYGGEVQQETSKRIRKKRKVSKDDETDPLHELIGSIVSNTNELKNVTRFIGYEYGLGQKRETVFNLLTTVEGLTDLLCYDLADALCKDSDRLEMFNGLPVEHRGPYLTRLMERIGLGGS